MVKAETVPENDLENSEEEKERGPYYLLAGETAQELEDNVNVLLSTWPYWQFMAAWRVGLKMYRELIRLPDPTPKPSQVVLPREDVWEQMH